MYSVCILLQGQPASAIVGRIGDHTQEEIATANRGIVMSPKRLELEDGQGMRYPGFARLR